MFSILIVVMLSVINTDHSYAERPYKNDGESLKKVKRL
jgi:hypothetical protein